MKILIVGAGGFIGSNLFYSLGEEHEVVGIDSFLNCPEDENISKKDGHHLTVSECADFDVLINCACTNIVDSESDPEKAVECNVALPLRLAVVCRSVGKHLVHFSSVSVAEEGNSSVYAITKKAGENLVQRVALSATIIRPANVYGPRQHPKYHPGVVCQFIKHKLEGTAATIFGDGSLKRPYTYVDDVVGMVKRHLSDTWSVVIPFSHKLSVSVTELARLVGGAYRFTHSREIDYTQARELACHTYADTPLSIGLRRTEEWMSSGLA